MSGTLDIKTRHVKGAYKGYLVLGKGIARPLGTTWLGRTPGDPRLDPSGPHRGGYPGDPQIASTPR